MADFRKEQIDFDDDITINGSLTIDNVKTDGNTISSTNTDGNIILDPNGTGILDLQSDIQMKGGFTIGIVDIITLKNSFEIYSPGADNVRIGFDAYEDSGWKSTSINSNFLISKDSSDFKIKYASGVTVGNPITFSDGFKLNNNGIIVIGDNADFPVKLTIQGDTTDLGTAWLPTTPFPLAVLDADAGMALVSSGAGSVGSGLTFDEVNSATQAYVDNWNIWRQTQEGSNATLEIAYKASVGTGGTAAIRCETDGGIYFPNLLGTTGGSDVRYNTTTKELFYDTVSASPARFGAYLSSTLTDFTGDGTMYTVICDTETQDVGGNYNNTTGVFTASVAGTYVFGTSFRLEGLTASHTLVFVILDINYPAALKYLFIGNGANVRDNVGMFATNTSCVLKLSASDQISWRIMVQNGTKVVDLTGGSNLFTHFSGCLLAAD